MIGPWERYTREFIRREQRRKLLNIMFWGSYLIGVVAMAYGAYCLVRGDLHLLQGLHRG